MQAGGYLLTEIGSQVLQTELLTSKRVVSSLTILFKVFDMIKRSPPPPGYRYVYRPWRRCKQTGRKLYARSYGLRAWPILVPE